MIEELREAGLSKNESKVYLALLDIGPCLAGQISRKSGLHRRTVYDTTEMLIKKGLIGYILNNNRRVFEASDPNRIIEMIEEKKNVVAPVVEELKDKFVLVNEKSETNFYKGKLGLKTIFEDQLNYSEILILGASPNAYDILQFYFKWYDQKRKKKKIRSKIISASKKISRVPMSEIRYLPKKYFNPLAINIYGDKVAIILWKKEPMGIVIKEKEVADSYRQYFELMWKVSKG